MVALPMEQEEEVVIPDAIRREWMKATYSEARTWFQWLDVFVPSDIADSMGISLAVAKRFVVAGEWHGIIQNTGDDDGREDIFEYVPLPPGPTHHPTGLPPERLVGYGEILCPRGMPVRIRTERDMRRTMSTPGARGHINRREARYRAMQEVVEKRRLKQLERAKDDPNWKKKSKKSRAV